jgi:predicted metal-dependent phosphoesterase TrpH
VRVDLHIHSTASDGTLAPAAVAKAASEGGLDVVALADHDTAEGGPAAVSAAPAGLSVLHAIEITARGPGGERHILGYGIDPGHEAVLSHTGEARAMRRERMAAMIDALYRLGVEVPPAAVEAEAAGAPLARPHLARAMVAMGAVRSHGEAFARYLGDAGPAYVPGAAIDVATAVQRIHAAGGLSVWAHPPLDAIALELDAYADQGLQGIEVYRPRQTAEITRRLARLTRSRGLLASGGSDWHGPWDVPLGTFHVDASQIAPLLERLSVG